MSQEQSVVGVYAHIDTAEEAVRQLVRFVRYRVGEIS